MIRENLMKWERKEMTLFVSLSSLKWLKIQGLLFSSFYVGEGKRHQKKRVKKISKGFNGNFD